MTSAPGKSGDDRRHHPLGRTDDLFRLLVDNVRDYAIFLLDPGGHIASWNPGAERIKGYAESEVLGRHYSLFYPPEAIRHMDPDKQLEIAAAEGRFETEGWRVRKDGDRFWAHVVIAAVRDEAGTLVGFGKVTGDMTAERNAREALERRTRQLAEAQQIAHLGSWEWDVIADQLTWSDELYRIFGVEIGAAMDLDAYAERLHPDDRERVLGRVREAIETGESYAFEHRLVRPDGEERAVQSRGEAIRDANGRVVRLVGTALDITEVKRSEERGRKLVGERLLRAEAEQTARRMRFLAEASQLLGTSLEYEETLRTVVRLAVPEFADWCAVDILGRDGTLDRLAIAHADPEKVKVAQALRERYPPRPDDPEQRLYRVLRSGQAEIIAEVTPQMLEAGAVDPEHVSMLRALGLRSAILAPIHVREHSLGVITFVNAESARTYERDDLVVAQELAGRAGLAIENAQLHLAERQARRHAEHAGDRMARLQAITAGLSEAVTPAAVAEVIVEQGVAALNAAHGSLFLRVGEKLELMRSVGVLDDVARTFRTMRLDADIPIAEAVRTGQMILLGTRAERDAQFPSLREVRERMGTGALVAVPLRSVGEVIGCLALGWREERAFTGEERDFLSSLARQCAQALERAWLYETEHEAREAAEAASQAKSQFLAMMSHELRTPLSAIIGYQELLSEGIVGPVSERQKEQLRRIRVSATHLRDLINQILSLSRIEAGKEAVARDEVDLAALTEDVILLLEQEAEAKGLHMRVDLPEGPVQMTSDSAKIRQILLNLVANAIKFTDEGSVRIELAATPDEATISVADSGIGISEDHRRRIFEAFTQVDQSMTRRAGGSGLGLPVSQRLAHLLGGRIELESEVGEGSRFTLRLPR